MASDVEVLRDIRRGVLKGWRAVTMDVTGWAEVLERTIAALEAREARPKVEGRMGDADAAAVEAWLDCRAVACPIGGPVMAAEWRRARASEAALEEECAQLRYERDVRLTQEQVADLRHEVERQNVRAEQALGMSAQWEAMATEHQRKSAALSERVATLEKALRRLDDGLEEADENPYCEGEMTARDIIRETGAVPPRRLLALSPPSKPETP